MRCSAMVLCAIALTGIPLAVSRGQATSDRNCDAGVARRQLTGQPMTDFMAACRAARVNPENLGRICNSSADQLKLTGASRQSYVQECTKGPD